MQSFYSIGNEIGALPRGIINTKPRNRRVIIAQLRKRFRDLRRKLGAAHFGKALDLTTAQNGNNARQNRLRYPTRA